MSARSPIAKRVGYCTNVHPGKTLAETRAQLDEHATAVRRRVAPQGDLNTGLWLSAHAASELGTPAAVRSFKEWLDERGLHVFTLNGFPYGDFHDAVVKHRVYEPSWADERRLAFTLNLAAIVVELIEEGDHAGISTLPLGWPAAPCESVDIAMATTQLRTAAAELHRISTESGCFVHLDIEPEPGCILGTSTALCQFYGDHLLRGVTESEERIIRRHVRVCHDICHAAVMFEEQGDALARYDSAGISVGKVQVSSAIELLVAGHSEQRRAALAALRPFAEDRYLHQTSVRDDSQHSFFEDLPAALSAAASGGNEEWRIHYHVPISASRLGSVGTTQRAVIDCLAACGDREEIGDFEVETYTWNVLPGEQRPGSIADGIAKEIEWLCAQLDALGIRHEVGP